VKNMTPYNKEEINEMKKMFLDEGMENIQQLETQIQSLEIDYDDSQALVEIFRLFHSFKGMAGTIGLRDFEKVSHSFESLVSKIQDKKLDLNKNIIDLFFESIDVIDQSLQLLKNNKTYNQLLIALEKKIETTALGSGLSDEEVQKQNRLKELFVENGLEEINPNNLSFDDPKQKFYHIKITLEPNIQLKLARLLVIIKNIEKHGMIAKTTPSMIDFLGGEIEDDFEIIFQSIHPKDFLKRKIMVSGEILNLDIRLIKSSKAKSMVIEEEIPMPMKNQEDNEDTSASGDLENVKVNLNSLDMLMELFGELLIRNKQLELKLLKFDRTDINEILFQMQNYMFNLQDIVLQMQLVPISSVFRAHPRMIRKLANSSNKDVKFVVKDHEVKVDRKILAEIGDIVNHLLRNAVYHGIETINERKNANKSSQGLIKVETKIENNLLALEVTDNGRGIDPVRISQAAIKKGLYTKEQLNKMKVDEIINLIFQPNFSSAEKVDEISGRGLGLNIVKEKVEKLGGSVEIDTDVGSYSRFKVLLPISRSLIRALLVKTKDQIFSIALDDIERLFFIGPDDIFIRNKQEFITLDEGKKTIKIYDLGKIFKIQNENEEKTTKSMYNVVHIMKGNTDFALIVDDFIKESEIVVKKIDDLNVDVKGVAGAAILDDGTVSLIIDPFSISTY
jgi:two-component system, chemotaxis family, sensor kinase CheA